MQEVPGSIPGGAQQTFAPSSYAAFLLWVVGQECQVKKGRAVTQTFFAYSLRMQGPEEAARPSAAAHAGAAGGREPGSGGDDQVVSSWLSPF